LEIVTSEGMLGPGRTSGLLKENYWPQSMKIGLVSDCKLCLISSLCS